tara:strand:+ start:132 stop:587 length:456 start_codon:yes stop_codon:yes gene_type:complete
MIINLNKNNFFEFKKIINLKELEAEGNVLVDLDFWQIYKNELLKSENKNIGVIINSDQSLEDLIEHLVIIKMICINFLTFKDGRPFTIARKLRELHGFNKQIRASGHILPDQSIFLIRSGFDSFEIDAKQKTYWEQFIKNDIGLYYQKVHI